MVVDGLELGRAAGKGDGDRGDMEVRPGEGKGRACMVGGEHAGREGGEGKGFFEDYALVSWGCELLRGAFVFGGWG